MEIKNKTVTAMDFAHLKGTRLLVGEDIERVEELSYTVHTQTEFVVSSFWATEIQDIVEKAYVEYTPADIKKGNFLGLRIKARDNELELTLGEVGREEPVLTIIFHKGIDEEGFQVLGDMLLLEHAAPVSSH